MLTSESSCTLIKITGPYINKNQFCSHLILHTYNIAVTNSMKVKETRQM